MADKYVSEDVWFDTAEEAVKYFNEFAGKNGVTLNKVHLQYHEEGMWISCYRPETDEEATQRVKNEERQKAYRRQQFETLKKEFGE